MSKFKEGDHIIVVEDILYNNKNRVKIRKGTKGTIVSLMDYTPNVERIIIKTEKGFNTTVYSFDERIERDVQYYREERFKDLLDEE